MFFGHGSVDGAQVDAGLLKGYTGSETAKELGHTVEAVGDHGCREVVWAGDDVGDDFGFLGIGDAGFEDADDGGRPVAHGPAAKADGFAEDGRIFHKSGRPATIGENDDAASLGTDLLTAAEPTEYRAEAHDSDEGPDEHASFSDASL